MSQVKPTQYTQAEFSKMLKEFDVNNDGQLDKTDSHQLQANRALDYLKLRDLPSELDLNRLLSRDNNGIINQEDVKRCRPKGSRGFACKRSQALDNKLKSKLNNMKKAQATDLKDREKPWTSDDLARELALGHPRLLKRASNKDKAFLLLLLRDAGAGKFAHVGPKDQEAVLKILTSIPADQRAMVLNACGGKETFETLMQGENKTKFQQLVKTNGNNHGNNGTCATPKGNSSSSSKECNKTKTTKKTSKSCDHSTQSSKGASNSSRSTTTGSSSQSSTGCSATSYTQSSGMDAAMGNLRSASKKVQDLWGKYRTAKPEEKKDLMMQIQMAQQEETQLYQFISSMMKSKHQITMGIIRNLP